MAFTKTLVTESVFGTQRVAVYNITPDATTGTFYTGPGRVNFCIPAIKSMAAFVNSGATRSIAVVSENLDASGACAVGYIAMTGCVANDVYRVVVFKAS